MMSYKHVKTDKKEGISFVQAKAPLQLGYPIQLVRPKHICATLNGLSAFVCVYDCMYEQQWLLKS